MMSSLRDMLLIELLIVDIQNWQIPSLLDNLGEPVRPVLKTGQTGLGNFVKIPIGLHHCVDLVETIEMHI